MSEGFGNSTALGAEIMGTFVLVYTVSTTTHAKCNVVHLAAIPITGTGINPPHSLGGALVYNKLNAWDDQEKSCDAGTILLLDSALLGSFYLPKMSLPMI